MKMGTIELTQGAVLYAVLMIVVIFIGIMIATKGQATILFEQKKFSALFDPGKLSLSATGFTADCSQNAGGSLYPLEVQGVTLDFNDENRKEGDEVSFYILLNVGDDLFLGVRKDCAIGDNFVCAKLTCKKEGSQFNCGPGQDFAFTVGVPENADDKKIHLTLWRTSAGVENAIGSQFTLSAMLDKQFQYYMGSADIAGTFGQACRQNLCSTCGKGVINICDRMECWNGGACYFKSTLLIFNSCSACPITSDCGDFTRQEMCEMCQKGQSAASLGTGCKWENSRCMAATGVA